MFWTPDLLFEKAKFFTKRAEADLEDEMRPIYSAIALEFLGRTCLAKVNPALLADPRDGKNILYASGIKVKPPVKSIVAKTVFMRCQEIIDGFNEEHLNFTTLLTEIRNAELHSGESAVSELPNSWEVDLYRTNKVLLDFLGNAPEQFYPRGAEKRVEKVIDGFNDQVAREVKKKIAICSDWSKNLTAPERKNKEDQYQKARKALAEIPILRREFAQCPACKHDGLISGETIEYSDSKLSEDGIIFDRRVLPTEFKCLFCSLTLDGYPEIVNGGLGKIIVQQVYQDPIEFFGIDLKNELTSEQIQELVREYYEDYDYGND